ncbi:MAG: hypothetical protein ACOX2M_02560 [Fastidiosipilaceae bacterium]
MKLRRLSIKLLTLVMTSLIVLSGCGQGSPNGEPSSTTGVVDQDIVILKPYVFRYNDTTVRVNSYAPTVIQGLGKPLEYYKAEGMFVDGEEDVYLYEGMEVRAGQLDDSRVIVAALIQGSGIPTAEGIAIGDAFADVILTYGEDYVEDEDGFYSYERDGSKLSFLIENEVVASIQYTIVEEKIETAPVVSTSTD